MPGGEPPWLPSGLAPLRTCPPIPQPARESADRRRFSGKARRALAVVLVAAAAIFAGGALAARTGASAGGRAGFRRAFVALAARPDAGVTRELVAVPPAAGCAGY